MNKSNKPTLEGSLSLTALIAFVAAAGLLVLDLFFGVSQEPVQMLLPSDEYARRLLQYPNALRTTFVVDNVFLLAYTTFFVLLGAYFIREKYGTKLIVCAAVAPLLVGGVLDLVENLHVLSMLDMAEQGMVIPLTEIRAQAFETGLKFHLTYLGLFLLAFVYPRETTFEQATVLLLFLFVPVGMLIHVTPKAIAVPLTLVRLILFVATFLLSTKVFWDRLAQVRGRK